MSGIVTFRTLAEAIRAGYQVYERTEFGFVMYIQTPTGLGFALVIAPTVPSEVTAP